MRGLVTLSFLMAVGGCGPIREEGGPEHGLWQLDTSPNEGWFCVRAGAGCAPPAYFAPPPMAVTIKSGGVLDWSGPLEHDGMIDGACIRVPAATEDGVSRTEETFCNLVEDGMVDDGRAFVSVGWSPGTPTECACSAHFDFTGD